MLCEYALDSVLIRFFNEKISIIRAHASYLAQRLRQARPHDVLINQEVNIYCHPEHRLTNHIVSKFLQNIVIYSKTYTEAPNNYKASSAKIEGVSTARKIAETHMAQAKKASIAVAGALAASMTAAAMPALAQEQTNVAPAAVQTQEQDAEATPRHELRIHDVRDARLQVAQANASTFSLDGKQAILLLMDDDESSNAVAREVVEAAQEALTRDDNTLEWVVVGTGEPGVVLYTSGVPTYAIIDLINDDLPSLSDDIVQLLAEELERVRSLDIASTQEAETVEASLN